MKKHVLLTLGASAALFLGACGSETAPVSTTYPVSSEPTSSQKGDSSSSTVPSVIYATGLGLDAETLSLKIGATHQVIATVTPENVTTVGVTYVSNQESVATVSADGLITAVSAGSATISVSTKSLDGASGAVITKSIAISVASPSISDIKTSGSYDVKAVVAAVTSKGYVLDDGTGAIYCYVALDSAYKLGDYVTANLTVKPYYAIWEASAVNSIAKAEGIAPTLANPIALTADMVADWATKAGTKGEESAPLATSDIVPVTFTAMAMADGNYTYFNVDGSTIKLEPSGLLSTIEIVTGVKYEVIAYCGGYNSRDSYASIYVESAAPKYEAITGITIGGTATVTVGGSTQLTAEATPTGADPHVTWSTGDALIATVDEKGVVKGVMAGTVEIKATSVADTTKFGVLSVTVNAASSFQSIAKYDFNALTYVSTNYGALTDALALTLFDGTNADVVVTGTSCVTAVTQAKGYYANPDDEYGPKIKGLKLGAGSDAGSIVLATNVAISKVNLTIRAWSATKLATISVNDGTGVKLIAADSSADRSLSFDVTAGMSIKISSSIYSIITSIELLESK